MKKLIIIATVLMALILSGCNFPGVESEAPQDPTAAMATAISKILTGTPVEIDITEPPVVEETEEPPAPQETEEPTEEVSPPEETEEPTSTPEHTDTPAPTPTPTLAETDPTLNLGNPTWVDNMENDDNWPTGSDKYTAIQFENGFLKLTAGTDVDGWRITWPTIDDFYLEATIQSPECRGNDHFGLMFRVPADSQAGKGYLFGINCDGRYSLRRWDGSVMHSLIGLTDHPAVNAGEDVVNKLGVLARDENLALYINGQKVREISDANYLEGRFGIFVGGTNVDDLTVWVDQIRYWDNP